ncbi:tyrosine-protein kinase family protein [Jannaschia seohaensis]|uniref:Chromosome partitioning ATPase, Mrp family, contains Fe-S cluster n=1 Tax=Jannaschia seohaensis TaxID=475081 RepID=A0A2Y9C8Y2_9RHOB|nr:CpsD/CapB family tyrosine-protein kinase [Jannaschia seohaensis]PWJ12875.1 Mrp family chromosome partitioning ATPase [Jannaschia seohaensis]SSA50683.1 Chromosome partitioning ATPase, Mrp family, contains Fe-S cluster [Jannaschia seohaensis]
MEKLRDALDKARAVRGGTAPAARPRGPAPLRGRTAATDAAWADLAAFAPDPKLLAKNRVVTLDPGREATPFDILRTKTLLQMRRNGWRRLGITSPGPACGKTTTAANLCLSLARQVELRTILMEMDLRRPALSKLLGRKPEIDIGEMLMGEVPFARQALRVRDNLAISMSARPHRDPARYMLSAETEQTLDAVEAEYRPDLVVFDLPPLLVSDDTRAFIGKVDCVLMVVRAEQSSMAQIDACEREISEHTNVLGMVLSHARFADTEGYYDYDYG